MTFVMSLLGDAGRVLSGLASLLWPVSVIVALILFKDPIANLIGRILHVKGPGFEADFDKSIENIKKAVEASEMVGARGAPVQPPPPAHPQQGDTSNEAARAVIETAADSARAGLMLLSADLEQTMRRILASVGHNPDRPIGIPAMARELSRVAELPNQVVNALREFAEIRNRIVHGHPDVNESEILRAVDVGLALLSLLQNLPYERHRVLATNIEIFSEPGGSEVADETTAVLLQAEDVDGTVLWARPFPTRVTNYSPGQHVTWEWDTGASYGPSWYRDPTTGQVSEAWTSSVAFCGRPLDIV